MKIEVLAATMNQNSLEIFHKMNIQTHATIVNQVDFIGYESQIINGKEVRLLSFNEKGVGLSRNSALMRSDADICLMADDDMVYYDGYERIVREAFKNNPTADVILFDVEIEDVNGIITKKITGNERVRYHNFMKFGTVNIAFRRKEIIKNRISFSLLFGGGAKYGSGEDTLFLTDCLNKNLKIYTHNKVIAKINYRPSSWFQGYNQKFLRDKGALFGAMFPNACYLIALQFVFRKTKLLEEFRKRDAIKYLLEGIREYKTLK